MLLPSVRRRALTAVVVLAVGALSALTAGPVAAAEPDPYRPVYHYSPAKNFMNDPNGLIYHDGTYHLYYQYNPYGSGPGNGSWGHATSPDLVHWTERPLAISTDATEDVWSGSVVFDRANSSGFGTAKKPPLVAAYTSFHKPDGVQRQSLAYSTDGGTTWTKYAQNPVIDIGSKDFRDPKVFWDGDRKRWTMVVALSAEKEVSIYTSTDLRAWTHRSDFGPAGATGSVWECPDLFPLTVDGKQKWVLTLSVSGKTQYFVGDFDGTTFTSPDASYTPPAASRVLGDFEGSDYGDWTTTGTAFGSGPVVPGPDVVNVSGKQVVDSYGGSDTATGTLTSPTFTINQPYLNFALGGGRHPYVPGGSDAPPAGEVFADFEDATLGDGWSGTGDFTDLRPAAGPLPGQVGEGALDTCARGCDDATGTITSPPFTITKDWINLLVAGGNHPLSADHPTAVGVVVDGQTVASATGQGSSQLDWKALDVSAWKGRQARIVVTDQRTSDWGHVMVDRITFSDTKAAPWNLATAANLIVDGKVVRTSTGDDGPGLDWRSWDLSDLQGKSARVQFVDRAGADWGHLLADHVYLAKAPALSQELRTRWIDRGNDDYAGVTYNDAPGGARISIGWMSNWDYADSTPTGSWRGQQTVARTFGLRNFGGRPTLVQQPVPSLLTLAQKVTPLGPKSVSGSTALAARGTSYRLDAVLTPGSASRFGLDVRVGPGEKTRIGYDATSEELYVDRTGSGAVGFDPDFARVDRAPLDLGGQPLQLTVLVDRSSVEVFANGGRVTISDLVYPSASSDGISAFADGGTAGFVGGVVTTLGPAIRR